MLAYVYVHVRTLIFGLLFQLIPSLSPEKRVIGPGVVGMKVVASSAIVSCLRTLVRRNLWTFVCFECLDRHGLLSKLVLEQWAATSFIQRSTSGRILRCFCLGTVSHVCDLFSAVSSASVSVAGLLLDGKVSDE